MIGKQKSFLVASVAAVAASLPALPAGSEPSPETPASPFETPIVEACVDKKGKLKTAHIYRSSGYPQLDNAALKVARASVYTAGAKPDKKGLSCLRFKVKFVIKDDPPSVTEAEPAEAQAPKPPQKEALPPAAPVTSATAYLRLNTSGGAPPQE